MPNKFQALRFAAAQRVQRLAKSQIAESDLIENIERLGERFRFADLREELDRLSHREPEQIVKRFAVELDFEHVRLEAFPFALRAAYVEIAQELHLYFFETG